MLVPLAEATPRTCGGKAGALGVLLRLGLPVPDGSVVPFTVFRGAVGDLAQRAADGDPAGARAAVEDRPIPAAVVAALERALGSLGDRPVAVRSSAASEDTSAASAAGQFESFLGVRGVADVADAIRDCWASSFSARATAYRNRTGRRGRGADALAMAVIVQRHLDAEVSGVLFTPTTEDDATVIEAAWGLGPSVVSGTVTPDTYRVRTDGTVTSTIADKRTRLDRSGTQLLAREVAAERRRQATLDEAAARELARLGDHIAATLGGPQDLEWAVAEGRAWVVQARPITASRPSAPRPSAPRSSAPRSSAPPASAGSPTSTTLAGTPASHGTVTGAARTVRGPRDFVRVRPGDILVCPFTDPAWTPLLGLAAGVVTETGGALSHAAIVAREHGIPAVVGVPNAMDSIHDGVVITIDGTTGTVTTSTA